MSVIEATFLVYKSAATLISKIGSAAAEPEGFQDSILSIDLSREEALLARYASPAILAFSVELGIKTLLFKNREQIKRNFSDKELEKKLRDHRLDCLFSILPEDIKNGLIKNTMENLENKNIQFYEEIEKYSKIFIQMRYFHEILDDDTQEEQSISFNDDFLSSFVEAIAS